MNRLYKFGKTTFRDVLVRFDKTVHETHGWRGIPLSQDYEVKVMWSKWVTTSTADEAEQWFKQTYPKTFYTEVPYNGITECRDWTTAQSYAFIDTLNEKFPKDDTYQSEIKELAIAKTLLNTHLKIYFVSLNKKQTQL